MTREEVIKIFNAVLLFGKCDCSKEECEECFKMAIKALEQEPILDKIRAEIENTMKYQYAVGENEYAEGFEKSLEIIDKHKAEQE